MDVSLLVWSTTIGAILALIIVDLLTVSAKPHEVKFKEAAGWSVFYIGIAIAFEFGFGKSTEVRADLSSLLPISLKNLSLSITSLFSLLFWRNLLFQVFITNEFY